MLFPTVLDNILQFSGYTIKKKICCCCCLLVLLLFHSWRRGQGLGFLIQEPVGCHLKTELRVGSGFRLSSDQDPAFAEAQTRVLNQLKSGSGFLTKLEIGSILKQLSPGSGFDAARIRIRFLKMLEYRTAAWIPVLTQRGNGFGYLPKLGPGF